MGTTKKVDIHKIANDMNKTLILLTNGKINIEMNDVGMKLNVPSELEKGMNELMKFGELNNEIKPKINFEIINDFFEKCDLKLKWGKTDNENYSLAGGKEEQRKFLLFLQMIGFGIDEKDLAVH